MPIYSPMCLVMITIMAAVVMVRMPAQPIIPRLRHHNLGHKEKRALQIHLQLELKRLLVRNHQIKIRLPIIRIQNPILQK